MKKRMRRRPGFAAINSVFKGTREQQIRKHEQVSLSLPPSAKEFLAKESASLGLARSTFVSWLLAYYRENAQEARSLALPWPPMLDAV
jgi:hypothetical protein